MPSLAVGTNWTFQGRIINRATGISVPATYRVAVTAADTQSTQFSVFTGSIQTGLKQQALLLTVIRSGTNVTPNTTTFSGIFLNNTFDSGTVYQYEGTANLQDGAGNRLFISVVTNANVCSGKQQAKFLVNYSDSYSTITGYVCRN